jgi:hypothetical protein
VTVMRFGSRAIPGSGAEEIGKGGNLAAPLLAQSLGGGEGTTGGDVALALFSAAAFATILAVVAGLVVAASGAHRARPVGQPEPPRRRAVRAARRRGRSKVAPPQTTARKARGARAGAQRGPARSEAIRARVRCIGRARDRDCLCRRPPGRLGGARGAPLPRSRPARRRPVQRRAPLGGMVVRPRQAHTVRHGDWSCLDAAAAAGVRAGSGRQRDAARHVRAPGLAGPRTGRTHGRRVFASRHLGGPRWRLFAARLPI